MKNLSEEYDNIIAFKEEYLESLGEEVLVINTKPKPFGTVKTQLQTELKIDISRISSVYLMSYDIAESIDYLNKDHPNDPFKFTILGNKNTLVNNNELNKDITQIGCDEKLTEHMNLIEFTDKIEFEYNNKTYKSKYVLYLEPFHKNKEDFGIAYIDNDDDDRVKELLKARIIIPNSETINYLLEERFIAAS
ncbi:MAG: hypothetical protein GQ570_02685 [Helicobacteraceae bacterium]|nr:hypothetical protein [Helicobacteraceae bacterium]